MPHSIPHYYYYSFLFNNMCNIDDYVTDNAPIVDKYIIKYNKKFTTEQ